MHRLGLKRHEQHKTFYVDKHEDPIIIEDRVRYIKASIGTIEQPSLRALAQLQWVVMHIEQFDELCKANPTAQAHLRRHAYEFDSDPNQNRRVVEIWPTPLPKSERPAMVGRDRVPVNAGASVERMVELHVECSELFTNWRKATEFGGNVSVRYPLDIKPIMAHGQDESVYDSSSATKVYVWKLHALLFC